jgi:hypothetical protein
MFAPDCDTGFCSKDTKKKLRSNVDKGGLLIRIATLSSQFTVSQVKQVAQVPRSEIVTTQKPHRCGITVRLILDALNFIDLLAETVVN